jgi:hypothetical protein
MNIFILYLGFDEYLTFFVVNLYEVFDECNPLVSPFSLVEFSINTTTIGSSHGVIC